MGSLLCLTIFLPAVAAIVVLFLGDRRASAVRWVSLGAVLATLAFALVIVAVYRPNDPTTAETAVIRPQMVLRSDWLSFAVPSATGEALRARIEFFIGMDGISLWLFALTALLMVPAVLVSWNAITEGRAQYYALLLILQTGMMGVFCAFDLILFYVFFEFTLIPLFFLIGRWGGSQRRYAAGKFFVYTLTGSLISLVGLLAIVLALYEREEHKVAPTFAIPELVQRIHADMASGQPGSPERAKALTFWHQAQWWAFLALFAGFAIKVPLFPFHTWLPLAHVEAPTAGSVLLAGVLLKLGSYGFLRLCLPLLPLASMDLGVPLVSTLAVIGIIYGSLCALAQHDIKRLVAYSSVAHLGFCMLGLFALNAEGMTGGLLQMINHGLSTGALFLLVGMLYERYHTRQMADYGGMMDRLPLLGWFMMFMCLSSIGLPGLNGFVGEFLCLIGMFKAHPAYAVLGAIGIVLGAWYILNMMQQVFYGPLKEPGTEGEHAHAPVADLDRRELSCLVPLAVACLLIGVFPKPFVNVMKPDIDAVAKLYHPLDLLVAQPSPSSSSPEKAMTVPGNGSAPVQVSWARQQQNTNWE